MFCAECNYSIAGNGEIDVLSLNQCKSCNTDNLTLHIDNRTPTGTGRDGSGNLDDFPKSGNIPNSRNDAI